MSDATDILTPRRRIGRFVVERELGRGGSSVVYAASDDDGRRVALKVLGKSQGAVAAARFARELEVSRAVNDPRVQRVHELVDVELDDGAAVPALVLDLVEGETLGTLMNRGLLDEARARTICQALAEAAHAVHVAGFVHGDLKPGNVMLGLDETTPRPLTILDLGAARRIGSSAEARFGSPRFTAPEVFDGAPASPRNDVYSIGVILYGALTGVVPYDSETEDAFGSAARARSVVRAPSQRRPGLSSALDDVVMAALAVAPSQRPPTAQALANALRS